MYERSAIVLERFFEKLFGFDQPNNLKINYENYKKMIEDVKEYQKSTEEEEKVIEKFDEAAREIESIQKKQFKIYESNTAMEDERNRLFNDFGENPNTLDITLQKIERTLQKNNEELKELREKYVKALVIFTERQKERNKQARQKRTIETNYVSNLANANKMFEAIPLKDVQKLKRFIDMDKENKKGEIVKVLVGNGKNERVPFSEPVMELATRIRMQIAEKEAEIYLTIYDKNKKLLNDLNNETLKLVRTEKLVRDASVKFAFLNAEKEYIVSFLDNERLTAMNGKIAHEKLMEEACKNFEEDIKQIDNLYTLIIKETLGKSTKKAYKELYNKTYLSKIQEKERNFEVEMANVKVRTGTFINSNYWRIEGIKNIYNVFQEEVSEKFEKDLSEYRVEDLEEIKEQEPKSNIIPKTKKSKKEQTKEEIEEEAFVVLENTKDKKKQASKKTNKQEENPEDDFWSDMEEDSFWADEEEDYEEDNYDDEYDENYDDDSEYDDVEEFWDEEDELDEEEIDNNDYDDDDYEEDNYDDESDYEDEYEDGDEEDYDEWDDENIWEDEEEKEDWDEEDVWQDVKKQNKKDNKNLFGKFFKNK